MLRVLNNYKTEWTKNTTQPPTLPGAPGTGGRNSDVSFLQSSGDIASFLQATNNIFFPAITCRLCVIKGHYQTHCPVAMNETGDLIKFNRPGAGNGAGGGNVSTGEEVSQGCGVILSQHNEAYIMLDSTAAIIRSQ